MWVPLDGWNKPCESTEMRVAQWDSALHSESESPRLESNWSAYRTLGPNQRNSYYDWTLQEVKVQQSFDICVIKLEE